MGKDHLKRIAVPKPWKILKKENTFVLRPNPGAHTMALSMPIVLIMKQLGYAQTTKECKRLLRRNDILVDGRRVEEIAFPIGYMDTLKVGKSNYRILLDIKGKLTTVEIKSDEVNTKICRIKKKTPLKKGKMQLNLFDSRNIIVDKDEYSIGDSILISVPEQKIQSHFKLEKGVSVCLLGGKHIGSSAVVEKIEGKKINCKTAKGENFETLKEYAYVVGKEKPVIKLSE